MREDGTDRKSKFSPRFSIDARNNSSPVDQAAFARTSDEDELKDPSGFCVGRLSYTSVHREQLSHRLAEGVPRAGLRVSTKKQGIGAFPFLEEFYFPTRPAPSSRAYQMVPVFHVFRGLPTQNPEGPIKTVTQRRWAPGDAGELKGFDAHGLARDNLDVLRLGKSIDGSVTSRNLSMHWPLGRRPRSTNRNGERCQTGEQSRDQLTEHRR